MRYGLVCLLCMLAAGCAPSPPDRIVLIVVDTLRIDYVGAYGGEVPTPNMDALAARGRRFTNAIASFHQTSMSMGAIFTGRTPSIDTGVGDAALPWNGTTWCGLARLAQEGDPKQCVPRGFPTLGEVMAKAGYQTLGVASNRYMYDPAGFSRGFDVWTEVGRPKEMVASARGVGVNAAVRRLLDQRNGDHFFLYVHYMDVHDYAVREIEYAQAVAEADVELGVLFNELESRDLLDGALVIFTSDHGEMLGEDGVWGHKCCGSFEQLVQVPLIVTPPAGPPTDALVRGQDLLPILAELAGAPIALPQDLEPNEVYYSEVVFRFYRRDHWKVGLWRGNSEVALMDLRKEPWGENVAAVEHEETVSGYVARVNALSKALGTTTAPRSELSPEDRERLRALGYLD